ncbi:MAG: hypothetical protein QM598_02070 [Protaetiibacter sp.]
MRARGFAGSGEAHLRAVGVRHRVYVLGMVLPAIRSELTTTVTGGLAEASSRVSAVLANFGARRYGSEGGWSVYSIGSRARFRALGLFGPGAHRRLPIKARTRFDVDRDVVVVVRIDLENDEGPYLTRLPAVEVAYRRAFSRIEDAVRGALS